MTEDKAPAPAAPEVGKDELDDLERRLTDDGMFVTRTVIVTLRARIEQLTRKKGAAIEREQATRAANRDLKLHWDVLKSDYDTVLAERDTANARAEAAELARDEARIAMNSQFEGNAKRVWAGMCHMALEQRNECVSKLKAAEARAEAAMTALRPFAALELWTDVYPDGPISASSQDRRIPVQWIVDARAALAPEQGGTVGEDKP